MAQDPCDGRAFVVNVVKSAEDLDEVRMLFTEYVRWLNLDLSFQNFTRELAVLPGEYAPPFGVILLARSNASGEALGCVALRPLTSDPSTCCEMKRLYVLPQGQGMGMGKALAEVIIRQARALNYHTLRLDTLQDKMGNAIALYRQLGFAPCERYYDTPLEHTMFLELDLKRP